MTKQQLPDWFDGELYEEGGEVTGRYSEEVCKLNNIELSMYDAVSGSATLLAMGMYNNAETKQQIKLGIEWFKENNTKAHQILLESIEYAKKNK